MVIDLYFYRIVKEDKFDANEVWHVINDKGRLKNADQCLMR